MTYASFRVVSVKYNTKAQLFLPTFTSKYVHVLSVLQNLSARKIAVQHLIFMSHLRITLFSKASTLSISQIKFLHERWLFYTKILTLSLRTKSWAEGNLRTRPTLRRFFFKNVNSIYKLLPRDCTSLWYSKNAFWKEVTLTILNVFYAAREVAHIQPMTADWTCQKQTVIKLCFLFFLQRLKIFGSISKHVICHSWKFLVWKGIFLYKLSFTNL